jgi:hypothetical protein
LCIPRKFNDVRRVNSPKERRERDFKQALKAAVAPRGKDGEAGEKTGAFHSGRPIFCAVYT